MNEPEQFNAAGASALALKIDTAFINEFRVELLSLVGTLHSLGAFPKSMQDKGAEGINAICDLAIKGSALSRSESVTRLTLDNERQVFFYEQDHYYLSNFSAFRVRYEGHWFDTSEQAYHYQRFTDRHHRSAIRASSSAHEAFRYAQDNKADQRPDWDAVKVDIMRCILCAKADQHEYVRRKLLQTGDRELVENSWRDPFWGWGENRDGKNMLGVLWMQVRNQLRLQETSNAER